jgi:hypothetical protein
MVVGGMNMFIRHENNWCMRLMVLRGATMSYAGCQAMGLYDFIRLWKHRL